MGASWWTVKSLQFDFRTAIVSTVRCLVGQVTKQFVEKVTFGTLSSGLITRRSEVHTSIIRLGPSACQEHWFQGPMKFVQQSIYWGFNWCSPRTGCFDSNNLCFGKVRRDGRRKNNQTRITHKCIVTNHYSITAKGSGQIEINHEAQLLVPEKRDRRTS